MKQKSKILKLKNKQKFLTFWHNWGGYFLAFNALICGMLVPINALFIATKLSTILISLYLISSIGLLGFHEIEGKDKLKKKKGEIEQEILELVKTDEEEVQILKEADKVEAIQKDIIAKKREQAEQKQLVKELIKKKNLEAAAQKNYVKYLTKIKKHNAKIEAIKEVEELASMPEISEEYIVD